MVDEKKYRQNISNSLSGSLGYILFLSRDRQSSKHETGTTN